MKLLLATLLSFCAFTGCTTTKYSAGDCVSSAPAFFLAGIYLQVREVVKDNYHVLVVVPPLAADQVIPVKDLDTNEAFSKITCPGE